MNNSMPIALQVKAYLMPTGHAARPSAANIALCTEIRRFVLTHPWNGIYAELVRKIESSFGDFIKSPGATKESTAPILTYWQDDENELVGFTSDDEMKYANDLLITLARSKSASPNAPQPHVFKVYIGRKQDKPQQPQSNVHVGVVCDGCDNNKSIEGIRYKCQACPDFDLCSSCEARGVHKDTNHTFTKIETPLRRCPAWGGFGGRAGFGPHHRGGHGGGSPFGDIFGQFMPVVNNPEELKRFGAHLKNLLEPFGVDVDYFVDNCTKVSDKEAEAKTNQAETTTTTTAPEAKSEETAMNTEETEPSTSSKTEEKPSVPEVDPKMTENPFLQVINLMQGFKVAESDTAASAPVSSTIEDGFVNLEPEIEKEMKIIRALESLKQMGYSDDGGWLMRLVISKEGNINAVLDALSPK